MKNEKLLKLSNLKSNFGVQKEYFSKGVECLKTGRTYFWVNEFKNDIRISLWYHVFDIWIITISMIFSVFFWTKSEAVLTLWLNKNYVCLKKASSITISNTVRMLKISFQEVLHRYVTMAFLPKCSASCFNLKSVLSLKHFFFYCTGCICENIWYKFYFHHHLPMITSICILCQGRQRKN